MAIDEKDKQLLALLSANCREPTAELARKMNLSRSTVKDRIERLEKRDIIKGYTIRLAEDYLLGQVVAHVMININLKQSRHVVRALRKLEAVRALHAVNGIHDMIAIISAESTKALDQVLDEIGEIEGIEKTVSSIILSTKIER
jgi:DNA-binding Lrp family transcriptional regulator